MRNPARTAPWLAASSWLALIGPTDSDLRAQEPHAPAARAAELLANRQWQACLDELSDDSLPLKNRADLLQQLGQQATEAREFDVASHALRKRIELLSMTETTDEVMAMAEYELGDCLESSGQPADALLRHQVALRLFERGYQGSDHANTAGTLNHLAGCLMMLRRNEEALPLLERSLEMRRRLDEGRRTLKVAEALANVGYCYLMMNRFAEARTHFEEALATQRELDTERPSPLVATTLSNLANVIQDMGDPAAALPLFQESLQMWRELQGQEPGQQLAYSLTNLGGCLKGLGRNDEALPLLEEAATLLERLLKGRDHPALATAINNTAACLAEMGNPAEAVRRFERVVQMRKRLFGDRPHPEVARAMSGLANALALVGRTRDALALLQDASRSMQVALAGRDHEFLAELWIGQGSTLHEAGRTVEALPLFQAADRMLQRLHPDHEPELLATSANFLGLAFRALGRLEESLAMHERALTIRQNLFGGDHPAVAQSLSNTGSSLSALGRLQAALERFEATVGMLERLLKDRDHAELARAHSNLASALRKLRRIDAALEHEQKALAMWQRVHREQDHPDTASGLHNVATQLADLGRLDEASRMADQALAMRRRLFDGDHPSLVISLLLNASILEQRRDQEGALVATRAAADMVDRLRETGLALDDAGRQSYFDELKTSAAFDRLQRRLVAAGDVAGAFAAAERSRARDFLDLVTRRDGDRLDDVEELARKRGDEALGTRARSAREEWFAAAAEHDRALARLCEADADRMPQERADLERAFKNATLRRRAAADERARLIATIEKPAIARGAEEIRSVLAPGELFLEFSVGVDEVLLFTLQAEGPLTVHSATVAPERIGRLVAEITTSLGNTTISRGRDPETTAGPSQSAMRAAQELFAALFPPEVRAKIESSRRVTIAPHRDLHLLPFEALVVRTNDGRPTYWLEAAPPTAYVQSGSVLHWMRQRPRPNTADIQLLVVGDPAPEAMAAEPKGTPTVSPPSDSVQSIARESEATRIDRLPPLRGARAEAEAIAAIVRERHGEGAVRLLLGTSATEAAVRQQAPAASHLHFACHGIAEELLGQSLSLLVLSRPRQPQGGDDGLLHFAELREQWQARLRNCRLAVLSACSTNVGPTNLDDSPQALPLGFLIAGAQAVIASRWAVDDEGTAQLMKKYYGQLIDVDGDPLEAFTLARRALCKQGVGPRAWAPFLFTGP